MRFTICDFGFWIDDWRTIMRKMTVNELQHDGWRRLKIVSDVEIHDVDAFLRYVPLAAQKHLVANPERDDLLDLHTLELLYPIYGTYDVLVHSQKKFRRLMFVHHIYARRVSECVDLARTEFFAGTHFAPRYAFVRDLPQGAEDGMDVHGCILLAAEWMPANCVATGGCDVY